jgi:hypothetical protein
VTVATTTAMAVSELFHAKNLHPKRGEFDLGGGV